MDSPYVPLFSMFLCPHLVILCFVLAWGGKALFFSSSSFFLSSFFFSLPSIASSRWPIAFSSFPSSLHTVIGSSYLSWCHHSFPQLVWMIFWPCIVLHFFYIYLYYPVDQCYSFLLIAFLSRHHWLFFWCHFQIIVLSVILYLFPIYPSRFPVCVVILLSFFL